MASVGYAAHQHGTSSTDEWSWNRGAIRMYFNSDNSDYNATPTYANNNGNLYRQDHFVPDNDAISSWSMSVDYYDYDAVNRVKLIAEHTYRSNGANNFSTFNQYFSYDRFGNRLISSMAGVTGVPNPGFKINGTNNRLIAPTDVNGVTGSDKMQYDLAGNLIKDSHTQAGTGTRTYDAENRMLTAIGTNGQTQTYAYDADGRRTRRILNNGSDTWWQVYGVGGEMVAEYQLVSGAPALRKEYGHRNGQLLVITDATNNTCQWLVSDALGTPRMEADTTGSLAGIKRHDYLPFGEELFAGGSSQRTTARGYTAAAGGDCVRQQFGTYERDNETGLDFAQARYYANVQGRFTSIDPIFIQKKMLTDPQIFNLFVYSRNNPLLFIDPNGEEIRYSHGDPSKTLTKEQKDALEEAVKTLREQSKVADLAFSAYDGKPGKGLDLDIQLLDDRTFNQLPDITPTTQGYATNGSIDRDGNNNPIAVSAIIMVKEGALNTKQELKDRKDKKETKLEGILSHEIGHVRDISSDFNGFQSRRNIDKQNNTPYKEKAAERLANTGSHVISMERQLRKHIKSTQTNLRW